MRPCTVLCKPCWPFNTCKSARAGSGGIVWWKNWWDAINSSSTFMQNMHRLVVSKVFSENQKQTFSHSGTLRHLHKCCCTHLLFKNSKDMCNENARKSCNKYIGYINCPLELISQYLNCTWGLDASEKKTFCCYSCFTEWMFHLCCQEFHPAQKAFWVHLYLNNNYCIPLLPLCYTMAWPTTKHNILQINSFQNCECHSLKINQIVVCIWLKYVKGVIWRSTCFFCLFGVL